ncbi:MAG: hypothetical protein BWK80_49685, partial [Desulfobacteraceae bacterium IS3]
RIEDKDMADLKKAKALLEKGSFVINIANFFGYLGEKIGDRLSPERREKISAYNVMLIEKSYELTMTTMSDSDFPQESDGRHLFYVTVSGAVGGVGILTLFAELPVTTVLMLRAVADIAKDEGEDYRQFETKIAALEVFALGGDSFDEKTGETGYYAIRALLDKPLEESSKDIAKKGAAGIGAPFAVQFIAKVAAKYQSAVSLQVTALAVPVAGAVAGAIINVAFLDFFQEKARGHFIVRRLERKYGIEEIKQSYQTIDVPAYSGIYGIKKGIEVSQSETDRILRHHVWTSMGVGLIPLPIADIAGLTIVQIHLLRKLAKLYGIPFSKGALKNTLSSVVGGLFPVSVSGPLAASITKFIPAAGQAAGVITMPLIAGATTYALGKVFIQHFASGGTFLSFDPEKVKAYYREMFEEGKKVSADLRKVSYI